MLVMTNALILTLAHKQLEFESYMRSNQLDKAVQVLKEDHNIDFTTYVNTAGYNCVHIAAAAGHLELMVEMLSRGLSFSPTQQHVATDSCTGNTPLHLAGKFRMISVCMCLCASLYLCSQLLIYLIMR